MAKLGDILKQAGILEAEVVAYTDGACHPNPGPGGWGAVLLWENLRHCISGGVEETTNNRMEIHAVLKTLNACKRPVDIIIYSDSKYVVHSVGRFQGGYPDPRSFGWIPEWRANGWRKSDGKPVMNRDLWELMWRACIRHNSVEMRHVKGHSGHPLNEEADRLAVAEKLKIRERNKNGNERAATDSDGTDEPGTPRGSKRGSPRLPHIHERIYEDGSSSGP